MQRGRSERNALAPLQRTAEEPCGLRYARAGETCPWSLLVVMPGCRPRESSASSQALLPALTLRSWQAHGFPFPRGTCQPLGAAQESRGLHRSARACQTLVFSASHRIAAPFRMRDDGLQSWEALDRVSRRMCRQSCTVNLEYWGLCIHMQRKFMAVKLLR